VILFNGVLASFVYPYHVLLCPSLVVCLTLLVLTCPYIKAHLHAFTVLYTLTPYNLQIVSLLVPGLVSVPFGPHCILRSFPGPSQILLTSLHHVVDDGFYIVPMWISNTFNVPSSLQLASCFAPPFIPGRHANRWIWSTCAM